MKTNFATYTILGLLGLNQVATADPSKLTVSVSSFPAYAATDDPDDTGNAEIESNGYIKEEYLKSGSNRKYILRAFRNKFYGFPTQKIEAPASKEFGANGTENKWALKDQGTTTRTWYQTAVAQIGAYTKKPDETAISTVPLRTTFNDSIVSGPKFMVCKPDKLKVLGACTGGGIEAAAKDANSSGTAVIAQYNINRAYVFWTKGTDKLEFKTSASASEKAANVLNYNLDFLIGAFYQEDQPASGGVFTGSQWCTKFVNQVKKDATDPVKFAALNGFDSKSKCTFQMISNDKDYGLGFKLDTLDFAQIHLQWVEFFGKDGLGTSGVLPTSEDDSVYKIGQYASVTGSVYLNPLTTTLDNTKKWYGNIGKFNLQDKNPLLTYPGERGQLALYPAAEGFYKETQSLKIDSWIVDMMYKRQKDVNSKYMGLKNTFETKRTAYNKAADGETARLADFFKTSFEPKIALPTRPCPPTRPDAWNGYTLDYESYLKTSPAEWKSKYSEQGMKLGVYNYQSEDYVSSLNYNTRYGELMVSSDGTALDAPVAHLFGKLGQGKATDYTEAKPFRWAKADENNLATIQVTVIPIAKGQTGLSADAKKIEFSAKSLMFESYDMYKAPNQPDAPGSLSKDPNASDKAMILAATTATLAATLALF